MSLKYNCPETKRKTLIAYHCGLSRGECAVFGLIQSGTGDQHLVTAFGHIILTVARTARTVLSLSEIGARLSYGACSVNDLETYRKMSVSQSYRCTRPILLAALLILLPIAISGVSIRANAQEDGEDAGFKVLGATIPTFKEPLNLDNTGKGADKAIQKGVFIGDFVGCKARKDLSDYGDAKDDNNRTLMAKFKSQGKCVPLVGRTYIPLRVGFGTSAVLLTVQGADILMWVKSKALMDSPPPGRLSHFNF